MSVANPLAKTNVATDQGNLVEPTNDGVHALPTRLPVHAKVKAEEVELERALVGVVQAQEVELRQAGVGLVFADGDVTIERGGARDIISRGSVSLAQGGAGIVVAGGDSRMSQSGAGALLSLGHMEIENGGAGGLVAGSATVGKGGFVGLAITPRLEVAEGARVLGGPAVAVGAIAGVVFGFALSMLFRAKGRSASPPERKS